MEIAKSLHFPFLLLSSFLLLFVFSVDAGNGGEKEKLILFPPGKQLDDNRQLEKAATNCIFQKPRAKKGTATLQMKQKDYCSGKVTDWEKNLQDRIILDDINVKSLQSKIKSAAAAFDAVNSDIPLSSGSRLQTLNYIVTVGIGGRNLTLIVDTGSDLTWVQCRPCNICYTQQEPLFEPSNSTSFLPVPCNSATCSMIRPETENRNAKDPDVCGTGNLTTTVCYYGVNYGDGSFSRGELGYEKLNLGEVTVEKFVFGCGRNNKGLFGGTSGLMGLDRSKLSLISQTSSVFGGIFSYCLPSSKAGSSGSLTLGIGDFSNFKNVTPISYTKLVPRPQMSNFYLLNLTGISVGGVKLDVPRFASSNGVLSLIDSGTVITRFAPSIYSALKGEFEKQFSGYPKAPGFSILNTCFNLSGFSDVEIPTVKFYFEGNAEMSVDVEGIFYFVKSDGAQICLAFASLAYEDGMNIIGNYQQKNQRVVYNSKDLMVGFAREPCNF